jgi:hypothetical protein
MPSFGQWFVLQNLHSSCSTVAPNTHRLQQQIHLVESQAHAGAGHRQQHGHPAAAVIPRAGNSSRQHGGNIGDAEQRKQARAEGEVIHVHINPLTTLHMRCHMHSHGDTRGIGQRGPLCTTSNSCTKEHGGSSPLDLFTLSLYCGSCAGTPQRSDIVRLSFPRVQASAPKAIGLLQLCGSYEPSCILIMNLREYYSYRILLVLGFCRVCY